VVLTAVAVGAVLGSVVSFFTYQYEMSAQVPSKPNILVLSLCSLRKAELDLFNPGAASITPNVRRAFSSGFALDNVYSSFGWTNLSLYFTKQFSGSFLQANGYDIIEDDWRPSTVHVPGRIDAQKYDGPPEQFVNFVEPKLKFVKYKLNEFRKRPFFAYIHIKYMHFPYVDRLNRDAGWDRFLNEKERARVAALLAEPAAMRDRLPFAMALSGDSRVLDGRPEFKPDEIDPFKVFFGMYNLLQDHALVKTWREGQGFDEDLELLRKVYRAKLAKLDEMLAPLLDLYGRKDLRDETLVVLMGDHGEAFMEHGMLGHGDHVYDEVLTLPVLVRYPRTRLWGLEHLREQIHMGSLSDWLKQIVTQGQREPDFTGDLLKNPRNQRIVSRNCSNNIHSVREGNRWKFIYDRVKREKALYDLTADPGEKTDVSGKFPQQAADLELHLANHLKDLEKITDPTPCKNTEI